MRERRFTSAEIILLKTEDNVPKWKVRVEYDSDHYLVLITGEMVTVYREQEMPETRGETMSWPTHMTGVRAVAIECVRRVRFGDIR